MCRLAKCEQEIDSAACFGVVIALVAILLSKITGHAYWDAIGSILIGLLLGLIAIWLIFRNTQLLVGASIPPRIRRQIEQIIEANRLGGRARLDRLRRADASLDKVRLYLRLAVRWEWLNEGQYQHVSRMVKEIGRLLGGWIKQTMGT